MSGLDARGIDAGSLPKEDFPGIERGFRVVVTEAAFDHATARGNSELDREIGGILVGKLLRDDGGPYVRVDAIIDALHAEEKGTELTFTHETWDHIHREMERKHPDGSIVGWFHTHPGFGIFLSDRDQFIHRSFFNLPGQIALVYDPKSREHGVFAWRDNEPARCRRYWVGSHVHTWEEPPVNASPETEERKTPKAPAARAAANTEPLPFDRNTLMINGIILLLLGGLLGWWIGGRSAGHSTEQLRNELLRERLEGAQDVARTLNNELMLLVREALGGQQALEPLRDGLARLDEGFAELDRGQTDLARAKLEKAKALLTAFGEGRIRTDAMLLALERNAKKPAIDPGQLKRILTTQAAVLGQVSLELAETAAQGGDRDRARRLIQMAIRVDSGRREHYERKLKELDKK